MDPETYSQNAGDSDEKRNSFPPPPPSPCACASACASASLSLSASASASASDAALPAPSIRTTAAASPTGALPNSVRGAPEALKPAIRKNQNKESARRSRRRRKEMVVSLSRSFEVLLARSHEVEQRVGQIERFLGGIGFQKGASVPVPPLVLRREPEEESEHGSRTGRSPQGGQEGSAEDEVQRLIERCMGQL